MYKKIITLIILILSSFQTKIYSISSLAAKSRFPTKNSQRPSSSPFISGDTFRLFCDHIFDETEEPFDYEKIKTGDTVFLNGDFSNIFFTQYHPHIKKPYILVSHNTDTSCPGQFKTYLEDPKIIAWFGQNTDIQHKKLHPLPIGLANFHWPHGKTNIIKECLQNNPHLNYRKEKAYLNFDIHTNYKIRQPIWDHCISQTFCSKASKKPYQQYLEDMKEYQFVISPAGNGLDCHRNWEALLMGCIIIIQSSAIDPLFDDLPVIIVDDLKNITLDLLIKKKNILSKKTFKLEKLYIQFWINQIQAIKQIYLSKT